MRIFWNKNVTCQDLTPLWLLVLCLLPVGVNAARRISLVDINLDGSARLMRIPAVTEDIAESIVKYRNEKGYFNELEDLKNVPGIDEELFKEIEGYLTITPGVEIEAERQLEEYEEYEEFEEVDGILKEEIDLDVLEGFRLNPLDLNTATKKQLLYLPYVTEEVAGAIISYRRTHRGFKDLEELKMVTTEFIIKKIRPYIMIFKKEEIEEFHGEIRVKYTMREYPFSSGYLKADEKYHNPAEIYSRLRVYYSNKAELGMVMRRDDGSLNLDYKNIMDYYLIKKYLLMRNMLIWDTLILGNYELSFGQGLVMYTHSSWGGIPKKPKGIQGDRGDDNNKRFYGIAGMREFGNLEIYGFYSNKPLIVDTINSDGTIGDEVDDVFGNKSLSYYRPDRFDNNDYLNFILYGGRVKYLLTENISVGSILYREEFDHIIDPVDDDEFTDWPYMFRGDAVDIYSMDVEYNYRNLRQYFTAGKSYNHIFTRGSNSTREWSTDDDYAWESTTMLGFESVKVWFNYHYIGPEFYAFHNYPLHAIYGQYRNEQGQILGIEYKAANIESGLTFKYGGYIVTDKEATEEQDDELKITAKLRCKPVRNLEVYLYNTRTCEYKEEEDIGNFTGEQKVYYRTNMKKIQVTYSPTDRAYLKWGFYSTDAGYRELNLSREEYPKYTLYSKVKYKPTTMLTIYSGIRYKFDSEKEPEIYWDINPKMRFSKNSRFYMKYRYKLTEEKHEYRMQYKFSW